MALSRTHPRNHDQVIQLLEFAQRMYVQQVHDVRDHVRAAVVGHDELVEFLPWPETVVFAEPHLRNLIKSNGQEFHQATRKILL